MSSAADGVLTSTNQFCAKIGCTLKPGLSVANDVEFNRKAKQVLRRKVTIQNQSLTSNNLKAYTGCTRKTGKVVLIAEACLPHGWCSKEANTTLYRYVTIRYLNDAEETDLSPVLLLTGGPYVHTRRRSIKCE